MASRPPARLTAARPSRRAGVALPRLAATLALLALWACGDAGPKSQLHDLVVELPLAEVGPNPGGRSAAAARGPVPALDLPAGCDIAFVFDLDGEAVFRHGGLRSLGDARLTVSARIEGEPERVLATISGPAGPSELALPGRGRRLVQLRLRAVGTPDGAILVQRPEIAGHAERDRLATAPPPASLKRPNVLLLVVDTLRRDRLGVYGESRGITPRIDAFAAGATVFEEAVAQASWTRPAVTSIMTGLYPPAHGVTGLDTSLSPAATTLAELFAAAGYHTAAVSTNWHVTQQTGLKQGFQAFRLLPEAQGAEVVRAGFALLDDPRRASRPFLLYLHLLDPHAPYAPPADLRQRYAADVREKAGTRQDLGRVYASRGRRRERRMVELRQLYDAEVASVDRAFGELLDGLAARGLADDTLVVLVADHGEEFDEHGMLGHGNHLHSEVLDIPMILRLPGQRQGERRADLAQHVDLFVTLLRSAGVGGEPAGLPGRDLRLATSIDRAAFSHLRYDGKESVSVQLSGFKLIVPKTPVAPAELYAHAQDPGEHTDLAAVLPVRRAYLLQRLRAFELGTAIQLHAEPAHLPDEAVRQLRALGYF